MNTAKQKKTWVEVIASFGFAAKGIVYAIIGLLAVQAAFRIGGNVEGRRGAFKAILEQPFGQFLLGVVAVGLIGYALWRFVQSIEDPDGEGSDGTAIIKRVGFAISGVIYGALAFYAIKLIVGSGGGGTGRKQEWTARLMDQPYGVWIVGLVGLIIIGLGIYQFYKSYSTKFREKLQSGEMSGNELKWATRFGRFGLAARGIVYGIIGYFLIQASMQHDPGEVGGLGKALQELLNQSYGLWLLAAVAFGLIAYGIYCVILAKYRRIYY